MPRRYQQQNSRTALKRALLWLLRLALLLAAPELFAQAADEAVPAAYVLSDRVGAVIDAEERAYFGFFPSLDGFASADVYAPTDTTVAFVISRQNRLDTSIVASREAAEALGQYIDLYEQLFGFDDARKLEQWGLVVPFARLDKPFHEGHDLTITTRDGEKISGRLLYIDDEVVVLSQADTHLERLTRTDKAVVLLPYEISHIEGRAPVSLRLFKGFEIPWAGNDSLYAAYTLPKLREESTFRRVPSPEVRRSANRALAQRPTPRPAGVPFNRSSLQRLSNRLRVSLSYPRVLFTGPETSYDVRFTPSSRVIATRKVLPPRPTYALEATYSLTKRWRLGGFFQRLAEPAQVAVSDFTGDSYSRVSGFVLTPLITYTLNPVDRLDFLYYNPLLNPRKTEIRFGAGPSYARLAKETTVTWRLNRTSYVERISERQRVFGLTSLAKQLQVNFSVF